MKKRTYIIAVLAVIAIIVIKLAMNKQTVEEKVYRYDKQQEILVSVDSVQQRNLSHEIIYTGTFEPFREGKIMAESPGKIIKLTAELGDFMRTGDTIAQMDNELLKLQSEAISIQIEGLERDLSRYTILANADAVQGIQLEKTQLALKTAIVQRKTLQEQINKTSFTAPFNGLVTQKFVELGTVLVPSMPIIQLTDISALKLSINVPESDLHYFRMNMEASIVSDTYPDKTLSGKVVLIGSRGDVAHNYPVQILTPNTPDRLIKAGMFGSVRINTGNILSNVTIPVKALFGSSLKQKVYVVENKIAIERDILVAFQDDKYASILSGLKPGETVVTSGFINLKNGSPVKYLENN
jgi:RND family efflux transporter MFP subunit